jgi:hypothetical protein
MISIVEKWFIYLSGSPALPSLSPIDPASIVTGKQSWIKPWNLINH